MKEGWTHIGVWMENEHEWMNMTRMMDCQIWMTCQDQIDGRNMDVCRKMYG